MKAHNTAYFYKMSSNPWHGFILRKQKYNGVRNSVLYRPLWAGYQVFY
ncbi:cytochrome c peroxidase/methylamine utilization protein MauG [Acetobacter orientalis]|uniref:Cytochrome c peroxidase/methylamine utilization protein MauG n=1 Tax=Acetobacter orientalis TaxID=146474 RepID=A0A2Z5ZF12_9PROT|nr:cytochrome c peroxidase/methylamine utilization protein MauG [Acetobacter orientalis]